MKRFAQIATSVLLMVSLLVSCMSPIGDADIIVLQSKAVASPRVPFPQNKTFPGTIKPSNVSIASMNADIKTYYDYWKPKYVKESNGVTPGGGYYVEMKGTGGSGTEKTTSEAHGYGMLVFALMAGYDADAKMYFDGMYNMYDKHRSKTDSDLMSWVIDDTESTSKDSNSATDGDMDIAYALLLANNQWGSDGAINYLAEAKRIITNGIKQSDMDVNTKRSMLGDWDNNQWSTRSSDWMTGHFRAFYEATGDSFWLDAANEVYSIISTIQANNSQTTGLMPDFIVNNPPVPAPPHFLEADTDDDYSWNSCRFPWRIALDYAHYGTVEAKTSLNKILNWLKGATNNNPANIKAGYTLAGTALVTYTSGAFTAPFVTASMIDSTHQDYLNAGWATRLNDRYSYYGDTINLLNMLAISGNWWKPTFGPEPTPTPTATLDPNVTPTATFTPTNTPTATPTPVCDVPVWVQGQTYTNETVSHNGRHWKAQWWTTAEPGTTGQWGAWKDLGPCPGVGNSTPTPTPTATNTATPTNTPVVTPTNTPVVTPTNTPVVTPTNTPVVTPTNTPTTEPTPTATPDAGVQPWAANTAYKAGDLVTYSGTTYQCRQPHTSLVGWEPPNVASLWLAM